MTDRLTPSVTDRADHVRHIAATSASLLQQLSTVDNGIFYMADVNVFVFLTELINILQEIFVWLSLTLQFASISSGAWSFLVQRYLTR